VPGVLGEPAQRRLVGFLWRDDAEPIPHGSSNAFGFVLRDLSHVADGVPQVSDQARLLNQRLISYQIREPFFPRMVD
jgi:hypothetical protein